MKFGIIKERKNPPDRRVVFTPEELVKLKKELRLENKKDKFKSLMELKSFCIEKYRDKILTNCCPTLLLGNRLEINEKGYLESYFEGKKIDINPEKAQKLWKILFENQEIIGVIKDDSIQKFIGKYIKIETESKVTKKLEEFIYEFQIDNQY